ncbi:Pantothenate kinase 2 [Hibiscus syriacus]|uniref:Pantothenate kinase 2 n=1 Tax=Hibiscus syriacus TaxID=106335 RepID=A0A6A2X4T7_HIBSY|nr:Pantothenate kinase 2 [Hibiscus syriacus]
MSEFPMHKLLPKKIARHWRVEPVFVDEETCFPFKPKTWAEYCSCTGGKGRIGSKVSLDQLIQAVIVPPPPISWYLRGITSKTTEMLIHDLLVEAARLKGAFDAENSNDDLRFSKEINEHHRVGEIHGIKQRWNLHRRNAKPSGKRMLTAA